MIDKKSLGADALPPELAALKPMAPLDVVEMTDLGVVTDGELKEKLEYLHRGVGEEYHQKILVTSYPTASFVMTLGDLCRSLGIGGANG